MLSMTNLGKALRMPLPLKNNNGTHFCVPYPGATDRSTQNMMNIFVIASSKATKQSIFARFQNQIASQTRLAMTARKGQSLHRHF